MKTSQLLYLLLRPTQLRAIIQWKLWHEPVHKRNTANETATLKTCFELLNLTSRSFALVIQELNPDMLVPITLFYLVLRGLDTIEDDMTLPNKKKVPLLRNFSEFMRTDGWTFTESGPNEKDRKLLVQFDVVIIELKKLQPNYYTIIEDIAIKMGNGMADYIMNAEHQIGISTIPDYEKYCHYVAGLVGEGLTRLFVAGNWANPALMDRPELTESMGQLLQKTNIIRDIHEDFEEKRRFWPEEIWGKYVDKWDDLFDKRNRTKALNCSSAMVLDALKHVDECLFYMAGIREQSVFNFVAIPQTMAIATLELVFRNPAIFERHIKITRGETAALFMRSTQNLQTVTQVFREYARKIARKNDPRDPLFIEISAACVKIEQFIETLFPTQDPKKLKLLQEGGGDEKTQMDKEGWMLIGTVFLVMIICASLMIGSAFFLGPAMAKYLDEFLPAPARSSESSSSSTTPPSTIAIAHGEL